MLVGGVIEKLLNDANVPVTHVCINLLAVSFFCTKKILFL